MDPVSDALLLTVASVSAGLMGLFLVGMIFYIQSGFSQLERSREVVEPYFRASTRIVLILYAFPLGLALTLVALPDMWSRLLFLALTLGLVAANVSTAGGVRSVTRTTGTRTLLINEVVGTAGVALMVILPLATGGFSPDREDLVPAILLGLGVGFLSTCVLVLTLFYIAQFERETPDPKPQRSNGRLWKRHPEGVADKTRRMSLRARQGDVGHGACGRAVRGGRTPPPRLVRFMVHPVIRRGPKSRGPMRDTRMRRSSRVLERDSSQPILLR